MIDENTPVGTTIWYQRFNTEVPRQGMLIAIKEIEAFFYNFTVRLEDGEELNDVFGNWFYTAKPPVQDPYFNQTRCVERLLTEWRKHGQLIVACDFDDTVFPFHGTGSTHDQVIQLVRECSDLGWHIVIFTASNPERYPMMREFLESRGIKVAAINQNPIELPFGKWGKPYYNICLDDRAGLSAAYEQLREVVRHVKKVREAVQHVVENV